MRILLVLLLLWTCPAMAIGTLDPAVASDGLLALIRSSANSWNSVLRGYATDIFWTLVVIQFVWKFGQMALRRADFNELVAELVKFIIAIGFFAALLLYSVTWSQAIVDSFRQAAAGAAGTPTQLQPGDLFALAVELGRTVAAVGLTDPVTAFVVALSATLIVLCFAFIAAFMMVTLIESYFVINAGVFFMAFGGSEWTREYAMAMLKYAVAVGAKLFVLQLIVGLIMNSARTWQAAYTHDETSMLTMLGVSLICAYFSKTLAETVQGLISGASVGGGSTLGGMVAAGMAGVAAGAAAMSAATGHVMLGGTGKSVSDLIKSSFGSSGSGNSGGSGASPMNFMNSGGGSSGGGSSASPRTGGGGHRSAPGTPPSAAPAPSAPSGNQSSASSTASSSGGQASSGSSNSTSPTAGMPANPASNLHAAAHMATDAAVRGVGVMGSLAVPGMESAAGTSIGPAPTPPDLGEAVESIGETPENVIRPASVSSVDMASDVHQAAPTSTPAEQMAASQKPIDTMKDLQQALINQGKIS